MNFEESLQITQRVAMAIGAHFNVEPQRAAVGSTIEIHTDPKVYVTPIRYGYRNEFRVEVRCIPYHGVLNTYQTARKNWDDKAIVAAIDEIARRVDAEKIGKKAFQVRSEGLKHAREFASDIMANGIPAFLGAGVNVVPVAQHDVAHVEFRFRIPVDQPERIQCVINAMYDAKLVHPKPTADDMRAYLAQILPEQDRDVVKSLLELDDDEYERALRGDIDKPFAFARSLSAALPYFYDGMMIGASRITRERMEPATETSERDE